MPTSPRRAPAGKAGRMCSFCVQRLFSAEAKIGFYQEATEVFVDDYSSTVADPATPEEDRSPNVWRGKDWQIRGRIVGRKIRIINVRPMTPSERRAYEQ